jgi:hypothetical protein
MNFHLRSTVITLLAALGLAVIAYIGAFVSGVPTIYSPLPALTVIPALLLSRPPLDYAVVFIPTLLFLAWNPQLMRHEGKIPKRTYALFAALAVLSILYLAASWKWGLQYQGPQFTAVICSINVAWIGSASACAPTDDGAATRPADPVAPSKAARSPESGFLPIASESNPHLADHVSVSAARLPEFLPDDQPDIRFPTLP